jgi:hypothetical protein
MRRSAAIGSFLRAFVAPAAIAIGLGALAGSEGIARAEPAQDARAAASQAEALVVAMDASSEHMRHLLRSARLQKWSRGIGCLDEALSRVDVALRAARDEARGARDAAREGEAELARAHLARVVRLREMARAAAAGGQMCAAGPELQPFEGTSVRVIVDPRIAPVTP